MIRQRFERGAAVAVRLMAAAALWLISSTSIAATANRRSPKGDAADGQPDQRRLVFNRPAECQTASARLDSQERRPVSLGDGY
jgi:hypothetical protein